jgi:two-component system chemotaxis response regulator CheB
MPRMNGIEFLKKLMPQYPIPVVVVSAVSDNVFEALNAGAVDFVTKPDMRNGGVSTLINELILKIKIAANAKVGESRNNFIENNTIDKSSVNSTNKILAIGSSTGGTEALYSILEKMPSNIPGTVIVQHMPPGFTKAFAERINKNTGLNVSEARDGEAVKPNSVYVAPGGYHMMVVNGKIKLDLSPTLHGVRPAVDKLFNTASEFYKGNLLACILTGMGKDGAEGIKNIKSRGGFVIAQDEYTSTVYGMPKAAFETGCVDIVLPENKIAGEITKAVKRV